MQVTGVWTEMQKGSVETWRGMTIQMLDTDIQQHLVGHTVRHLYTDMGTWMIEDTRIKSPDLEIALMSTIATRGPNEPMSKTTPAIVDQIKFRDRAIIETGSREKIWSTQQSMLRQRCNHLSRA
jgi:hypothetical protein